MGKKDYTIVPAFNVEGFSTRGAQEYTRAQLVMREDMEAMKAGRAVDEVIDQGRMHIDPITQDIALKVISDNAELGMTFSLRQWSVIQMMIEQGAKAGLDSREVV